MFTKLSLLVLCIAVGVESRKCSSEQIVQATVELEVPTQQGVANVRDEKGVHLDLSSGYVGIPEKVFKEFNTKAAMGKPNASYPPSAIIKLTVDGVQHTIKSAQTNIQSIKGNNFIIGKPLVDKFCEGFSN